MEPDRAIQIVQKLADGVDQLTDERFPSMSPYQQTDTVRALRLVLEGLTRGKPYQVVLSRSPAGSGLSTTGSWWTNVRFEAPPEFGGLNGPETVVDGTLTYNAHTVHIETPFRSAYDLWRNPGTIHSPFFDLTAIRLAIDGPLVFCHNTTVGEISLTTNSLVIGPVDWIGLPPVTAAQMNPLVFDPSTVTPGAYIRTGRKTKPHCCQSIRSRRNTRSSTSSRSSARM
jgi:hypothetical protein